MMCAVRTTDQQHQDCVPLTSADIECELQNLHFQHSKVVHAQPGDTVVKSIALNVNTIGLVICVLHLDTRLHLSRVAAALGLARADVQLVCENDLVRTVGFPKHCIGPVGSRTSSKVCVCLASLLTSHCRLCCTALALTQNQSPPLPSCWPISSIIELSSGTLCSSCIHLRFRNLFAIIDCVNKVSTPSHTLRCRVCVGAIAFMNRLTCCTWLHWLGTTCSFQC